jgi:hypothetical protein
MNKITTQFAHMSELLATLAVKSQNLVDANNRLVIVQMEKQDAEITLTQRTADVYTEGLVQGTNDATRKASLASLTIDECHGVEFAERGLVKARCILTCAEIEYRTITTIINATMAYAPKN